MWSVVKGNGQLARRIGAANRGAKKLRARVHAAVGDNPRGGRGDGRRSDEPRIHRAILARQWPRVVLLSTVSKFTQVCATTEDLFPTAGTSCTNGSVPGPMPALHWSCESCAAGSPPAALPSQMLRSCPQAFRTIRRSLHLRRPCRRPPPAKPCARPLRLPLLLPPAAPAAPPHCAARVRCPANCSAAVPRSCLRQKSFLSTHSAPPLDAQNAPPA